MECITSRNNEKVKYACSLKKTGAQGTDAVLAEGLRLCADAAANGVEMETCFLTAKWQGNPEVQKIIAASRSVYLIEEHISDKLADTKHPQGVFCICRKPTAVHTIDTKGKYLFLENTRDPGNFGTMMRTAEAFGLSGIMAYGCCDAFSPKVMRASMGAVFRFPVIEVADENDFLAGLTAAGMQLYCSVVEPDAADVSVLSGKQGIITAVGNEANGLSESIITRGTRITIHMSGRAESFNASQAATVMMYEMSK